MSGGPRGSVSGDTPRDRPGRKPKGGPPLGTVSHPIFARFFARTAPAMDHAGMADHRRRLLAGLRGEVIEVGAGTGLNFAHYPSEVTRVLAVEPEPYLRRQAEQAAEQAAAQASTSIDVVDGSADDLPAQTAAFDAAVVSLVLCTVPDPGHALAEISRVLRPAGRLRFLEHVLAQTPTLRRVQIILDKTVWPILVGGCHSGRDTAAAIEDAAFTIESIGHFRFPDSRLTSPTSPHIIGTAARA